MSYRGAREGSRSGCSAEHKCRHSCSQAAIARPNTTYLQRTIITPTIYNSRMHVCVTFKHPTIQHIHRASRTVSGGQNVLSCVKGPTKPGFRPGSFGELETKEVEASTDKSVSCDYCVIVTSTRRTSFTIEERWRKHKLVANF